MRYKIVYELPEPKWVASGNRWRLMIQVKGVRRAFYSRAKTLKQATKECREKAREWLELMDNMPTDLIPIRLWRALELYLQSYAIGKKSSTVKCTEIELNAFFRPFNNPYIHEITKTELNKRLTELSKNRTVTTMKSRTSMLINFYKWCARQNYIKDSKVPIYLTTGEAKDIKTSKKVLTTEQVEKIFANADKNDLLILAKFILLTGLRIGEALALNLEDFNQEMKTLRVNKNISPSGIIEATKTKNGNRIIPLCDEAIEAIKQMRSLVEIEDIRPNSPLLTLNSKTRRSAYCRAIRLIPLTLYDLLGVRYGCHELRHTFITYTKKRTNFSLDELKQIYGHSKNMNTEAVYVHEIAKTEDELKEEKLKIDKLRNSFSAIYTK